MANPIAHEVGMLLGDEGEVVGEVPVDDGEDEPATREAGYDVSRRTLDGASGFAARSGKTSRSVQSQRWRVGRDSRRRPVRSRRRRVGCDGWLSRSEPVQVDVVVEVEVRGDDRRHT